ncbi:MAG TPA: PAS domain S-box protein [Chthoniobacterales bacterium]|nr:PAS domain S-box protein [Chthoniobacterales bacterium]
MADSAEMEELDPAATDETTATARDGARKRRDPNEPSAIVGLGASAGGVSVLQQFFADMSPESGLAFVVVMHLSPAHESNLASILQQQTPMPVVQVNDPVKVRPNHVYVIPPHHQLVFNDGMLDLRQRPPATGRPVTIDLFFRTLADSFGQRSVGVILSGTDSDGVIGLKHIRAQGGVTMAQDPDEAEHSSMPLTAIATGLVDWVLPVAQMPAKLMQFVCNENAMRLPPEIPETAEADAKEEDAPGGETVSDETRAISDENAIVEVLAYLRSQTGHDFAHYKRATILRRIARRMQVNLIESIPDYLAFLRKHPGEPAALLQDLLIGVTHFFRDQDAFAALEANIPQLFAAKTKEEQVRAWVVGCATGEEAYSVAMLLSEYAERFEEAPGIQVFATDIDEQALVEARDGRYPLTIEADVSQERLRHFFTKEEGSYQVRKSLREKVLFAAHNFLGDAPFSRMDLVSCRNLLIYLGGKAQEQAFEVFHFALRSAGLLFIGGSESNNVQGLFAPVDPKHRIYARRSVPRPLWKMPGLPLRVPEPVPSGRNIPSPLLPPLAQNALQDSGIKSDAAAFLRQERRGALFGALHLRLLEHYAPPSIVLNEQHDIVHLSEKAGQYLRLAAGEPSTNVFKLIRPELQIELRACLFSAARGDEHNVRGAPQTVHFDSHDELVSVQVRRVQTGQNEIFFLILLQQQEGVAAAPRDGALDAEVARGLDEEIVHLKQELASAVEQYEGSNEELKATNEELQAVNEEMRSATEELQTSKEELQSGNEELSTVNAELKSNVEELSRANADLNNLMGSTDIGTIFLNRQLRVHRFTPSAQKIFNLLPTDLGRPLADLTHHLEYEGLMTDVEDVLDRLATIEREVARAQPEIVARTERRWYVVRIAPYRTKEDRVAGVVVTFIDITRRKRAEDELRAEEQRYRTLFELVPVAVYSTDAEGVIKEFNHRAVDLWGRKPGPDEKFCGSFRIFYPDGRPMPHEKCPMARVLRGEEVPPEDLEILVEQESGARRNVVVAPRAVRNAAGELEGAINCLHDISVRKGIEEALRSSEERLRTIADNVPQVIWTNEAAGNANYFNKRWYEYTGLSYDESAGPGWQAVVHSEDAPASVQRWKKALAAGEVFDSEYRLRGADGKYRWFIGRNVPLRDANGHVVSWFGTATDIHDLKEAERALRTSDERFRLLVEGARDYAMFLLDPANVITFWSAGAERVFGWTQKEAIGQSGAMIFTEEDRRKGAVELEIDTALREGRALDRRFHLRKGGDRFWTDGVLMRLDDEKGELRGFAKVARDATDQRRIEDQLAHARDEMEQRVVERTQELLAMNNELERTMAQRRQLERELLEISEREKRRIGEDLHDMVCQELTATALFLKSSAKKVARRDPVAAQTLEESAETVNRNVGIARDLARVLQAVELTATGLREALRDLAASASINRGVKCIFKAARGVRVSDDTVALHLYRIAQEAVTNALKHSGAKNILVHLDRGAKHLCVSVQDDGKGFDPSKRRKGLGVHMMRYRANALGGELTIQPRKTGGMDVTCRIPLKR